MTDEEAIKVLKRKKISLDEKYYKAIDMAIKALQTDIVHCYECKYDDSCCQCVDIIDDLLSLNFCSCGKRKEVEE